MLGLGIQFNGWYSLLRMQETQVQSQVPKKSKSYLLKKLEHSHVYFHIIIVMLQGLNIWLSGIKSTFTVLSYHQPFSLFSFACKTILYVLNCYFPCIPLPAADNYIHHSTLCTYEFDYSKYLIGIKHYVSLLNGLPHLA